MNKKPVKDEKKSINVRCYTRVSTTSQAQEGESLSAQIARMEKHCEYKGYKIVGVYTDEGISAKNMVGRPQLQKLLKDIQKDEILLVTDLSRLARHAGQALLLLDDLQAKGIVFQCLNPEIDFSSAFGKFMFTVLSALAEMERANVSAHTKQTMQHLKETARLRTVPPFGYKFVAKDKDHEPDPEQQVVLKKIITMHEDGLSDWKIAQMLNMEGDNKVLKPRGKKKVGEDMSEKQKKYNKMFPSGNVIVIPDAVKQPQFTPAGIHCILVDHGKYEKTGCYANRLPLEQRIKSFRKPEEKKKKSIQSKKIENPEKPKFVLSNLEIKELKKKKEKEEKKSKKKE